MAWSLALLSLLFLERPAPRVKGGCAEPEIESEWVPAVPYSPESGGLVEMLAMDVLKSLGMQSARGQGMAGVIAVRPQDAAVAREALRNCEDLQYRLSFEADGVIPPTSEPIAVSSIVEAAMKLMGMGNERQAEAALLLGALARLPRELWESKATSLRVYHPSCLASSEAIEIIITDEAVYTGRNMPLLRVTRLGGQSGRKEVFFKGQLLH